MISNCPPVSALTRSASTSAPLKMISAERGKLDTSRQRRRRPVCTAGAPLASPEASEPQPMSAVEAAVPSAAFFRKWRRSMLLYRLSIRLGLILLDQVVEFLGVADHPGALPFQILGHVDVGLGHQAA